MLNLYSAVIHLISNINSLKCVKMSKQDSYICLAHFTTKNKKKWEKVLTVSVK